MQGGLWDFDGLSWSTVDVLSGITAHSAGVDTGFGRGPMWCSEVDLEGTPPISGRFLISFFVLRIE